LSHWDKRRSELQARREICLSNIDKLYKNTRECLSFHVENLPKKFLMIKLKKKSIKLRKHLLIKKTSLKHGKARASLHKLFKLNSKSKNLRTNTKKLKKITKILKRKLLKLGKVLKNWRLLRKEPKQDKEFKVWKLKDQDLTRSDLVSTRNIKLLSVITRPLHTSILVSTGSNKDGTKNLIGIHLRPLAQHQEWAQRFVLLNIRWNLYTISTKNQSMLGSKLTKLTKKDGLSLRDWKVKSTRQKEQNMRLWEERISWLWLEETSTLANGSKQNMILSTLTKEEKLLINHHQLPNRRLSRKKPSQQRKKTKPS